MPAVRAAVELQNKNASAQGRPTDRRHHDRAHRRRAAAIETNLALWKDRAAGAIGAGRELRLRDLRAVVTSAKTVSLDEEARAQLKELQVSLTARVEHLRTQWNEKLEAAISGEECERSARIWSRDHRTCRRASAPTRRLA